MKVKKMKVVGNRDNVGHHFDMDEEVLLIQDFVRNEKSLNTAYKICLGARNDDDGYIGLQTVAEDSLELVEMVEYPSVTMKNFFTDEEEVEGVDLGAFDTLGFKEERYEGLLKHFQEGLYSIDKEVPSDISECHLIVTKDTDGDYIYTVVTDKYLE